MKQKVIKINAKFKALDDNKKTFEGYGAYFGNRDLGGDIIEQGAFAETLRQHNSEGTLPMMFWGHNASNPPIGKWTEMYEDEKGLLCRGYLFENSDPLIYEGLKSGTIRGLSIGYETVIEEYSPSEDARIIRQAKLYEVSPVNFPMNTLATVSGVKSVNGNGRPSRRQLERILRDAGFSRTQAKKAAMNYTPERQRESAERKGSLTSLLTEMDSYLKEKK